MLRVLSVVLACAALIAAPASSQECSSIADPTARLACFDKPKTAPAAAPAALDFGRVKQAMNAKYPTYFAHHKTTLIGSKTEGDRKVFFIKVPDPNPELQIVANCLGLDGGGWMCTLRPNYGTFGALPLPIK